MAIPNLADLLRGIVRGQVTPVEVFQTVVDSIEPEEETPTPLTWDEPEKRRYEYGVSKGILFRMKPDGTYERGVPWNGLANITDAPEGADNNKIFADNAYYANIRGTEEYHASIEAYTYPDEFSACDGSAQPTPGMYVSQQERKKFGLCWQTEIGNANTESLGHKTHIAYGLTASPTEKPHDTVNDSPEANPFDWDLEGTPTPVWGYRPTSKLEFDSTRMKPSQMEALDDLIYGDGGSFLPSPNDIFNIVIPAHGRDEIGRMQITGEIDYVKDGVLYRGANAPTILISDTSELEELTSCNPGSFAMIPDMSRMWQLDAYGTWVRMI